jgi:hypothetical protein
VSRALKLLAMKKLSTMLTTNEKSKGCKLSTMDTTSTKQMKQLPKASKILAIQVLIPMEMLGMFPPPLFFFTIREMGNTPMATP